MLKQCSAILESLLFSNRKIVLFLFFAITLLLGWSALQLRVDAGFQKQLPLSHPYMQTFMKYQEEFGGANRLLVAVEAKHGDIFTEKLFTTIKKVTDELFFLPGVNRSTVRSIFTPNERFVEIVEGGFAGGNIVPADFKPTAEGLSVVRENILKAGAVGRLVASDFSAALISAQLVEIDPGSGKKLDYLNVAKLLEEKVRQAYENDDVGIHIIGFAKVMGDIAEGARGVLLFFGVAFVISIILVYFFTHSFKLTVLPLLSSIVAVIWSMGLLTLLGFGIDPLSILVPFLIFAIGISHGVQMVNFTSDAARQGKSSIDSARYAFRLLILPGTIALISDAVGFLTILLIDIRIIQELAITASIGVFVIVLTNLVLLPLLLSYASFPESYRLRLERAARFREPLWRFITKFTTASWAITALVIALFLFGWGYRESKHMKIGDSLSGVPELRADSRYNQDSRFITSKFTIGVDILTTIVETVPNGCVDHEVMTTIDNFQWQLANLDTVQSTISLPQVAKIINAGWNEGNPKWRVIPRNSQTMVQSIGQVETATGLLNSDCSVMPVLTFMKDHKVDSIKTAVATVETFAQAHNSPQHTFRLATGNVGVMAATNEVVEKSQFPILIYIYATIILLCLGAFRSLRITICIVLPLTLVSVLCYALMSMLDIGLKVSTLPVAALGVGIGVDYGIYIFGRLKQLLDQGESLSQAYLDTLRVTGNAVLVTGLTLALGVSTWTFSALKFQADMGILLAFMFLANMIGALVLLPALARFIVGQNTKES